MLLQPKVNGDLRVAPFDLRELMKQLNRRPPVTADKNVFRKVAVQTTFVGRTDHVSFTDLDILLDDTRMKGNLIIADFSAPDIRFGIGMDTLNMDRYLPAKEQNKTVKTAPPKTAKGATTTLPVQTLRSLKTRGDLAVGKLTVNHAKLSNVRLNVNARDGKIKIDPLTADLYQGSHDGHITLDATGKLPNLKINSSLLAVQVEPLLNDITGKAKLRGKGNFQATLMSTGSDIRTMKETLNGQMRFVFRDGAVKGFNVGKFLRQLKQFRQSLSFKVSEQEETDFAELKGSPTVTDGVVVLNDLEGKSPGLRIQGQGVVADLTKDTINYTASVTVVDTSKGQSGRELAELNGFTLPIKIHGTLKGPKIDPDISAIVTSRATKELEKQILKKLGVPTDTQKDKTPQQNMVDKALKNTLEELKEKFKFPF
jgi:AsmA protein